VKRRGPLVKVGTWRETNEKQSWEQLARWEKEDRTLVLAARSSEKELDSREKEGFNATGLRYRAGPADVSQQSRF